MRIGPITVNQDVNPIGLSILLHNTGVVLRAICMFTIRGTQHKMVFAYIATGKDGQLTMPYRISADGDQLRA